MSPVTLSITRFPASKLPPLYLHVRAFAFDSPEYHAACELRRRFLREPIGLPLSEADLAGEDAQHHIGLFTNEPGDASTLIGNVIGKPDADHPDAVRIRQVIVHPHHRGTGHGRLLMIKSEELFVALGYRHFILYARDEAAAFYDHCGYERTGEIAELIGMPHHRMEKS